MYEALRTICYHLYSFKNIKLTLVKVAFHHVFKNVQMAQMYKSRKASSIMVTFF